MTWSESVDEALCFGWIDGVRKRIDDHGYSIRFAPSKATPPGYKKVMLHWVTTAKRAETRASRLAKLVEACAAGQRLR